MEREAIIAAVMNAGVVGAGGAGFPTHVKLSTSADTVVVNAAECEPLLHVDTYLLDEYPQEVMRGLSAALVATGAKRAVIGLKQRYASKEKALKAAAKGAGLGGRVRLALLPNTYPVGDEHVLVHEATGRTVPPGGIPIAVGVVVLNVETLLNVARALAGRPVMTKFLTVAGEVDSPFTTEAPLGIAVSEILAVAGARLGPGMVVLDGGPMMGKVVGLDAVVTKTTKGLLVLPEDSPVARPKLLTLASQARLAEDACCQCRACTDICPRYLLGHELEPHRNMRSIALVRGIEAGRELLEQEARLLSSAFLCSECGACEVIGCRMGLSPRAVNQNLKKILKGRGVRYIAGVPAEPREFRMDGAIASRRLLLRSDLSRYDVEACFRSWPSTCPQPVSP